jgi:quercetin dioxygenase-like cupin family protein
MNTRKAILIPAIGLAAVAIFGVTALATAAVGFHGTVPVRGTLTHEVNINADGITFQTEDEADIVVQTITIDPGGSSGWHTHPGFLLAVVESGAVSLQVGCSTNAYSAGQSFHETGTTPTMARNVAAGMTVVRVTYIVPKGSPTRLDVPESQIPVCD